MKAVRLRTEYLENPIGIDITQPRFYWNCEGGLRQTAYMILAKIDGEIVWCSDKVSSSRMTHIRYEGRPLRSRERLDWSVKLWDENDREGDWVEAFCEMGLLEASDWKAKWISGNYKPRKNVRYPVDCFKRDFSLCGPVKCARLYITACGLYEAKINGRRVGSFCLAPGCTDYRYRLQYQTYDVTEMLSTQNDLKIQLADGWYRGSIGCFGQTKVFGQQTKLLCQLEITYDDGSDAIIVSDDSFSWSNDGPLRFADLKDGETYDAQMSPSYSGHALAVSESLLPSASNNVVAAEKEVFSAKLITTPSGARVLDFGQNMAGFISFEVTGEKGQQIKLRMGETLDENGEFTQENMQVKKPVKEFGKLTEIMLMTGNEGKIRGELQPTPLQEVNFTCSGGLDRYKTTFAIFGFRFALIETEIEFDPADFAAVAVYSDMESAGDFECSNADVNRFYMNTVWSMKSNFLDVPTDCPTRERLGWTGDAQVFFDTAAYLMDTAAFFRKWLADVRDAQLKSGKSSAVVPYNGFSMLYDNTGGSVGWADAVVLIPYRFWKRFGDESILRDFYDMMRKYAMFMIKNTGHKRAKQAKSNPFNKYVYEKGMHLGEWLEPEEFKETISSKSMPAHPEEATAYLHYTMTHMAEIAHVLGKSGDEALFTEYSDGAKKAYDYLFLQGGTIDTDRQAKLVRPLALGLLDGEKKENVQKRLAAAVENRGYRIGTGFLSTPFVLPTLTEAGFSDLAYKMLENTDSPSWLAEVEAGATTVWEDWEGTVSLNHYSPGAVCQWMFDTIAGIRVAGENHFMIASVPGGTLTYANAEYRSIYGKVESCWEKSDSGYTLRVVIPSNTSAEIRLPGGECHHVQSGAYTYQFKMG